MEKSSKLPRFPILLTGNSLRSGEVVYFDGNGWTADLAAAILAEDEPTARRFETIAADSAGLVEEPYLVTASVDAGGKPVPAHYREAIRAAGPTITFGEAA